MKPDIKARIEGFGFKVGRVEARGKEFLVELTRAPKHVKVQVPEGCEVRVFEARDGLVIRPLDVAGVKVVGLTQIWLYLDKARKNLHTAQQAVEKARAIIVETRQLLAGVTAVRGPVRVAIARPHLPYSPSCTEVVAFGDDDCDCYIEHALSYLRVSQCYHKWPVEMLEAAEELKELVQGFYERTCYDLDKDKAEAVLDRLGQQLRAGSGSVLRALERCVEDIEGCVERYTTCMDKYGPDTRVSQHYLFKPEKY
jgi:hypothetical protein